MAKLLISEGITVSRCLVAKALKDIDATKRVSYKAMANESVSLTAKLPGSSGIIINDLLSSNKDGEHSGGSSLTGNFLWGLQSGDSAGVLHQLMPS